jgi:NAD(P)-dependent dehydrogenase (short-subunit alcohol dehydrogenase family)
MGYDVAITARTVHEGDAGRLPESAFLPELAHLTGSLDSTAAAIEAEGRRAVPLVLDLLDADRLQPVAKAAIEALGTVDLLVNNAIYVGPAGNSPFLDTPPDELEKRIYGNVTAQVVFTQPVLRHMVGRGGGTIANITSGAGYNRPPGRPGNGGWALSYGVAKAAVTRIATQLVAEHAADGIRAYSLNPGPVATERVLAAGPKLAFVADVAAPVAVVGETIARIVDTGPPVFHNGDTVEVQDIARIWGLL